MSSIVASLTPLILVNLYVTLPKLWMSVVGGDCISRGIFPFGMYQPLSRCSIVIVLFASGIYCLIGCIFSKNSLRWNVDWKDRASQISLVLAIAGLLFILPLMSTIWSLAIKWGHGISFGWGHYEGNHGPWRHIYDLRKLLFYTMLTPIFSGIFAFLSTIIKFNKLAWIILFSCIIAFFALIGTHYWLID